jgi:hypothetical protein
VGHISPAGHEKVKQLRVFNVHGSWNWSVQLFHDSNRQQYGVMVTRCSSYSCFVLLKIGDSDARNMWSSCQIKWTLWHVRLVGIYIQLRVVRSLLEFGVCQPSSTYPQHTGRTTRRPLTQLRHKHQILSCSHTVVCIAVQIAMSANYLRLSIAADIVLLWQTSAVQFSNQHSNTLQHSTSTAAHT